MHTCSAIPPPTNSRTSAATLGACRAGWATKSSKTPRIHRDGGESLRGWRWPSLPLDNLSRWIPPLVADTDCLVPAEVSSRGVRAPAHTRDEGAELVKLGADRVAHAGGSWSRAYSEPRHHCRFNAERVVAAPVGHAVIQPVDQACRGCLPPHHQIGLRLTFGKHDFRRQSAPFIAASAGAPVPCC
jgi:hypothetical protein